MASEGDLHQAALVPADAPAIVQGEGGRDDPNYLLVIFSFQHIGFSQKPASDVCTAARCCAQPRTGHTCRYNELVIVLFTGEPFVLPGYSASLTAWLHCHDYTV